MPLIVAWLLAFGKLLDATDERARGLWAVASVPCAAVMWAVHGRLVVAVVLSAAALAVMALRGRASIRAAGAGLLAMGGGLLGGRLLNDFLVTENYGGRDFDEAGSRLEAVGDVEGCSASLAT